MILIFLQETLPFTRAFIFYTVLFFTRSPIFLREPYILQADLCFTSDPLFYKGDSPPPLDPASLIFKAIVCNE